MTKPNTSRTRTLKCTSCTSKYSKREYCRDCDNSGCFIVPDVGIQTLTLPEAKKLLKKHRPR